MFNLPASCPFFTCIEQTNFLCIKIIMINILPMAKFEQLRYNTQVIFYLRVETFYKVYFTYGKI